MFVKLTTVHKPSQCQVVLDDFRVGLHRNLHRKRQLINFENVAQWADRGVVVIHQSLDYLTGHRRHLVFIKDYTPKIFNSFVRNGVHVVTNIRSHGDLPRNKR